MGIPDDIPSRPASWKTAAAMKNKNGGYVFCETAVAPSCSSGLKKNYHTAIFGEKLKIKDIPARWQDITSRQRQIDAVKKRIAKNFLKF